jgi:hypothetical protein
MRFFAKISKNKKILPPNVLTSADGGDSGDL